MVNPLDFTNEDEYNEAMFLEGVGYEGDARRCPRHPGIKTSSPDGLHDGICGACEDEMEDAHRASIEAQPGYCAICDRVHEGTTGPHSAFYFSGFGK